MKRIICAGFALMLVMCDSGLDINLDCVLKHTAEVVNVQSALLGEKDQVFVNLTWTWTFQKPDGDAVIVERSFNDSLNYVALDTIFGIDTLMYFNDSDSLLTPNGLVFYRLAFLNGKAVDYFVSTSVVIPEVQNFYNPAQDTVVLNDTLDTLRIVFKRLVEMETTDVAIYAGGPTSVDSLLNFLTNPLFDTTITDTILIITNADLIIADTLTPYTIRISSSKMGSADYITDTSVGFRAFIRLP